MALTATDPRQAGASRRRTTARRAARTTARYLAIWLLVLAFVFPFLSMLSTAFKLPDDIFSAPPSLWPTEWTLQNFVAVFEEIPFWQYLLNTIVIAGLSVLGMLIASPLVAYSLSKIGWRGQRPLLVIVMATMMLPPQVTMIPLFLMWNGLGATNSIIPLVAPAFFGTPFLIFMLRQFLTSVPNELLQAARIDGASELRIYWSIVLPQARPALITAAIFQFVWAWTDFLNPLIYLNDASKYTLSIGLYSFFGERNLEWGPLMAASVLFTLPALVLFVVFQRYFVGGVGAGALK
ncbi:carbohydrate ABC transporter membrane protein 2 (CUT1 family) [Microbacterium sp. AG790]|uniref:carbohydrate ABC transporter permease n=1 Tax=Microbacterium sp. AG790 TaxID=2183995 RepID=UPI000EB141DE|nr:carbohydrate ABC transporter permease [Microbacterium sp. AG790]RKS93201.1 carbohydrate ABC transporter membrane protein 2 (CUT1 family) [Microbacterium sp. AG790]